VYFIFKGDTHLGAQGEHDAESEQGDVKTHNRFDQRKESLSVAACNEPG